MTEWYDVSNDKFTKMLRFFSVVEAYSLIYPRPSGENSSFACLNTLPAFRTGHRKTSLKTS